MSAERLREAASLLRERAEAATPGPWHVCDRAYQYDEIDAAALVCGPSHDPIAANSSDWYEPDEDEPTPDNDAAYIATMSPPVALALADWLEHTAFSFDWKISFAREKAAEYAFSPKDAAEWQALVDEPKTTRDELDALAVADAILGDPS